MSARRVVGRWLLRTGLVVLVGLVFCAAVVYGGSEWRLRQRVRVAPHGFAVAAADARMLALGRHEAVIHGCTDCHGENLAGRVFLDSWPIGRLVATNLTRGSDRQLSDDEWDLTVRHGVTRDGRKLKVMPAEEYAGLSDEDFGAIVAWARSLPAVRTTLPRDGVGPLGRALFLVGMLPLLPADGLVQSTVHVARVVPEPTAPYGAYLAAGCRGCHGRTLSGGKIPGMPPDVLPATNLTPDTATGIGAWTEDDFVRAMHEGVRPDSSDIDAVDMPIKVSREMTDTEVRALYRYLRTVPPRRYGLR